MKSDLSSNDIGMPSREVVMLPGEVMMLPGIIIRLESFSDVNKRNYDSMRH